VRKRLNIFCKLWVTFINFGKVELKVNCFNLFWRLVQL